MIEHLAPAWHYFRQRLLRLWQSRGGGYYGLVAALTFLYLETVGIAADFAGLGQFSISLGWVISFLVGSFVDAILNGVWAALWPLKWVGLFGVGPKLLVLLGGSYVVYRVTRPAVLRLLGDDAEQPAVAARSAAGPRIEPPAG